VAHLVHPHGLRTAHPLYVQRRLDEGLSKPEIIRILKRHVSNAVYRQLLVDAAHTGR
jgi:hypothetical protein